jgi:uncharacterized membrane protein YcjF (UPF0283 family)
MEQEKKVAEFEQVKEFEQEKKFEEENELEMLVEIEDDEQQQPMENEMQRAGKKRRELIFELSLFFVLGILLGITIKTEAVKRVTMGYNDYQINKSAQRYDVGELKRVMQEKIAEQQAAQKSASQGQITQ